MRKVGRVMDTESPVVLRSSEETLVHLGGEEEVAVVELDEEARE